MKLSDGTRGVAPVTGLFFGSFNPMHNGHLGIARYLLREGYCGEVWFVISPCNPFKADQALIPERQRLEIVKLAIAGESGMRACDIEFGMPKPSYTADTLRLLFGMYPGKNFALVIGGDNVSDFSRWKEYHWILEQCPVFVYPRPGVAFSTREFPGMVVVDAPLFPLSATGIREKLGRGEDVSSHVPEAAYSLIRAIYREKKK